MGVIDLMSVLSDCKKCKKELLSFGEEVLKLEEGNIEKLKPYILVENNKPNSEITDQAKETGALKNNVKNQKQKRTQKKRKANKKPATKQDLTA